MYINVYVYIYIYIYIIPPNRDAGAQHDRSWWCSSQGFQGYALPILRIRYLVPRMLFCVVFSCLAILRIEGCLNSTL